ncbi:carcinine hydrolase/isopenicillin-N N-acyltransferase family protein [Paenibacillus sp. GCM10028914]|uniref:carcinine hydrolase/isopenicillin-N N-acyltransferase family protein n=1 Tax=Paenibacillus sp. GCM10028914 TaxID=3273416 RepID=UPI00361C3686
MSTSIYVGQDGMNFLGKNQDIPYDGAYVFTNLRNIAKRAMVMPPEQPVEWCSLYGSVTVSQVGKEMPNGGMNEAGLVVEQTTLWQSSYPEDKTLLAIGELPWIQLMLDTCASVQEVIETASSVRIIDPMSRLHYIVCDRLGDCAIVEFLNGQMNVYRGETLPVAIIANTAYAQAIKDLEDPEESWRENYDDYSRNSMERFIKAAASVARPFPVGVEEQIDYMFEALRAAQREDTIYSLVYDVDRKEVHFLTNRHQQRTIICFEELDFSLDSDAKVLDLQQSDGGYCNERFEVYTANINRKVVESFFNNPVFTEAFGWTITEEMITFMASFPDMYQRTQKR